MSDELKNTKIFPLNQTARNDVLVRGNPITTRTDTAVENTFPGLEFDHRNLEKQFFPGLVFEFHLGISGVLRDYDRDRDFPFTDEDYKAGLLLWRLIGRFPDSSDPSGASESDISMLAHIENLPTGERRLIRSPGWQTVRELEPGEIGIVLGPLHPYPTVIEPAVEQRIEQAISARQDLKIEQPGELPILVLFGQRADYLKDGVIDPDVYEPGDLTRSLCSPWQYDFTDCGCFYWASNKPDMVAVTDDGPQIYNFQRIRTGETAPEPPTHPPVVNRGIWLGGGTDDEAGNPLPVEERVPPQMNHAEVINGWETLPVVINDHETDRFIKTEPEVLPDDQLFTDLTTIIKRLQYLAGIEHALMVEYLYAYYSINAPRDRPDPAQVEETRLFEAAYSILGVAIDEMRHFRWVNEILVLLGQAPVIHRATKTEDTDNNDRYLEHTFELVPANHDQINWFITVEQSSQDVDPELQSDTIDGMYTRLLLSIEKSAEIDEALKSRITHMIKLIIDEGYDHYHRFQRVLQLVPAAPDLSYLQLPEKPGPLDATHVGKGFEIRADRSYEVILNLLLIMFGRGNEEHGQLLEATRIAMVDSLDVEIRNLIAVEGAPLFSVPRIANSVNLGRFSLNVGAAGQFGLNVNIENDDAANPDTILANATRPLDDLNERALATEKQALVAEAERSSAAMSRVREAFIKVMRDSQ